LTAFSEVRLRGPERVTCILVDLVALDKKRASFGCGAGLQLFLQYNGVFISGTPTWGGEV
jgi:hypothetical protein